MPRKLRLEFPGAIYHEINRGKYRAQVFASEGASASTWESRCPRLCVRGELRVTKDGQTHWLAVSGGFAEVEGDRVHVLAEHAITEEKIEEDAVEAALKRAEEQLLEAKDLDPQQYEHLQNLVRYSGVQLALKRRRR